MMSAHAETHFRLAPKFQLRRRLALTSNSKISKSLAVGCGPYLPAHRTLHIVLVIQRNCGVHTDLQRFHVDILFEIKEAFKTQTNDPFEFHYGREEIRRINAWRCASFASFNIGDFVA